MKILPINIRQNSSVNKKMFSGISGMDPVFLENVKKIRTSLSDIFVSSKEPLSFLLKDSDPQFEKFLTLIDWFKQKRIGGKYFLPIVLGQKVGERTGIDFEKIDILLNIREKSLQNKAKLNQFDRVISRKDIDELLFSSPDSTIRTIDLIGENAFIYSFKEKLDNVVDYIAVLGGSKIDDFLKEELMKITNPQSSKEYKMLTAEIIRLKRLYQSKNELGDIKELQRAIATVTKKRQILIENALKDPKDILEAALVVNSMEARGQEEVKKIIKLYSQRDPESVLKLKTYLNKKIFNYYGFNLPDKRNEKRLDFTNSKYLSKLFYAPSSFNIEFSKLIHLLEKYPDKKIIDIFNDLPQNKLTQKAFDRYGYNYKFWTEQDSVPPMRFSGKTSADLIIRKVDMEDIVNSLFLGEKSDCCTKINGKFGDSSVTYIKNKMVQAIEVLDGDQSIGNTMCYMAMFDQNPCLILDNIELRHQYHHNPVIRNGVFNFAKELGKKVCGKDIPVYLSPKRNDISIEDMKICMGDLMLVGNTGQDNIYLNFVNQKSVINNETRFFGKRTFLLV